MPSVGSPSEVSAYFPSVGELIIAAYRRIGIHRAEILTEHLADAHTEANLMQVSWANLGPLFWTVDIQTVALVAGTSVYSIPANTVMVLDMYISTLNTDGVTYTDSIVSPISRTVFASVPEKATAGSPQQFWFDHLVAPTVTLYPVPDGTDASFSYYRFTQIQDANSANAGTAQILYLCLDAFVAGLAYRLSMLYPPKNTAIDYEAIAVKALNNLSSTIMGKQSTLGTEFRTEFRP